MTRRNTEVDPNTPLESRDREFYGLSMKQWMFVIYYAGEANFNRAVAIRMAGYGNPSLPDNGLNDTTAYQMGNQNLRKPNIKRAIEDRMELASMASNEVLARISKMARSDMRDLLTEDPTTGNIHFDLDKAKRTGAVALIKKINFTSFGTVRSVEFYDAQHALQLLGKHHRLFDRAAERVKNPREEARELMSELLAEYEDVPASMLVARVVRKYAAQGVTEADLNDVIPEDRRYEDQTIG